MSLVFYNFVIINLIMKYKYAKEKLTAAIYSMVTGIGPIRVRLFFAFQTFPRLSGDHFPDELKDDWNFIHNNLTAKEPSYDGQGNVTEGRVQNTLQELGDVECVEIATRMFELYSKLQHL